ncbi:MAG: fumarylacetoacetate hydrolase family protein [Planctomycetes bacterium]|nr:fumarylacetoacetate hydrolase family protein [Planctomycetota bacterium]
MPSIRCCVFVAVCAFGSLLQPGVAPAGDAPVRYCRFAAGDTVAYGIVEGEKVRELAGDLFGRWEKTNRLHELGDVKLLVPAQPTQVLALAGNYKSHLGDERVTTTITTVTKVVTDPRTGETTSESTSTSETRGGDQVPPRFQIPQPFFKSPSCLIPDGGTIVLPRDAEIVHYEAELVIVIGRKARNVPQEKALDYVLGVTCGNDISARVWQKNDVQWWRAKGSDTFGPCGPFIASGVDYDNLLMQLRLNGEVRQKERTSQMMQSVDEIVSFISRHVTLHPGDLIFTGTPGTTAELSPGDTVEVELEGVGVLRNRVAAE